MKNFEKETRLVFNYGVTRRLLEAGCTICDIKSDRENEITGKDRCIHVFKNDETFKREFKRINREIAETKAREAAEKEAAESVSVETAE
jgi:hypothetical protein